VRVLVLFTRDLRVHDHPALWEACNLAESVVPLFVVDPSLMAISPNRARFLSQCLVDLDRSLAHRGGRLVVREGDPATEAARLADSSGCAEVFLTHDASAVAASRLERLRSQCATVGVSVREFPGHAAVEPGEVVPAGRTAYRVFTPYLRAWLEHRARPVRPAPRSVMVPSAIEAGRLPDPSALRPTAVELPPGGEKAARRRLRAFLAGDVTAGGDDRNDLAADRTSRLSPYLRFGCVSAAEIACTARPIDGADEFVRQLAWRDYFLQLLEVEPAMSWRDLRPSPPRPESRDAEQILEAWKEGRTGIPLVDAGMRQLLREGWMHNRARLVAASYLTRRAGVPWQAGAAHFFRHLVDGDPASNAGNWQWVAGTGTAPRRGRALNPVLQARRFDPSGSYAHRYVSELADRTGDELLRPWRHADLLRATGYPAPAMDL
jgi:deoxyribodipyrimidine photo-lyase